MKKIIAALLLLGTGIAAACPQPICYGDPIDCQGTQDECLMEYYACYYPATAARMYAECAAPPAALTVCLREVGMNECSKSFTYFSGTAYEVNCWVVTVWTTTTDPQWGTSTDTTQSTYCTTD